MDNLPKELLIEIFTYLPVPDLQSVSLTCQKFNNIVSNNSKLLQYFEIQFIADHANNEWIGSRKYTKLFIDGSAVVNFLYIIKQIGHEIENLIINCYDLSVALLKQILLMCENVKELTVYNATNDSDPEDYGNPLPKYDLNYLYFRGDIDVFKIFTDCTAKSLDVRRDYDDESHDVDGLKTFLKRQKILEDLKMENFDRNSSLFSDEMLTSVDFKLKRLRLKNFDDFKGFNFWEFLEHHKESLWYLEGCSVDHEMFSLFRRFKNLKTLKIQNMCSDFSALNYIETLYLKNVDGKWTEKLQNVKNLTISEYIDDFKQLQNLKHLEALKISNCTIPTLTIPTVKRLTLKRVELEETKPFEYDNGCEIEELKIDKCKNVGWLMEFLIHKTFNLKSLIINKSIIIDDDLKFIEDYRNRIQKFEISNCYGLTEEDIDDDEDYGDEDFSDNESASEEEEEEEEENSENSQSGSSDEEEDGSSEHSGDERASGEEHSHVEDNTHTEHETQSENEHNENRDVQDQKSEGQEPKSESNLHQKSETSKTLDSAYEKQEEVTKHDEPSSKNPDNKPEPKSESIRQENQRKDNKPSNDFSSNYYS